MALAGNTSVTDRQTDHAQIHLCRNKKADKVDDVATKMREKDTYRHNGARPLIVRRSK